MSTWDKRLYWRSVFDKVIPQYLEVKSWLGSHQAINYEKALDGSKGSGVAVGVVRVTPIDFVADVELAAKAALSDPEFALFRAEFIDGEGSIPPQIKDIIREKVGRMLRTRRIYPVRHYMKSVDTR